MLDLDTIFDPARVEAAIAARYGSKRSDPGPQEADLPLSKWSDIGVEDLPGDWRVWFEERAAIKEYHGGLPRELAEAQALAETVQQMQDNKEA